MCFNRVQFLYYPWSSTGKFIVFLYIFKFIDGWLKRWCKFYTGLYTVKVGNFKGLTLLYHDKFVESIWK